MLWRRVHLCQVSHPKKPAGCLLWRLFGQHSTQPKHPSCYHKTRKKTVFASLIKQRTEPWTSYKMSRLWINSHQCWCCCWLLNYHGDKAAHECQPRSGMRSRPEMISETISALPGSEDAATGGFPSPTPPSRPTHRWCSAQTPFPLGHFSPLRCSWSMGGFAVLLSLLLFYLQFLTPASSAAGHKANNSHNTAKDSGQSSQKQGKLRWINKM